jgi:hypothetical protein
MTAPLPETVADLITTWIMTDPDGRTRRPHAAGTR